jgi:hypothetical protein
VLRPSDPRVKNAIQELTDASGGQLPQALKDLGRTDNKR